MKKTIVCILILLISISVLGCTSNNGDNYDNNLTSSKQLFMDINKEIIKSDNFDLKLDESYIVNSADDEYTFYYYKGYFTPTIDEKIKIDYFEVKPANYDYFYDVSFNSGIELPSVLIYLQEACTIKYLKNNVFEKKSDQLAYCFEFVIASYNDYIKEPFFVGSKEQFDENMKDISFVISFNNKEEQVKLHYNNQCYISSDKIEEGSLLYKYYNNGGFGLKVEVLK